MAKILVIDDEQAICWGLRQLGEGLGHLVVTASSFEQASSECEALQPDVIISDVRLPGIDGLQALSWFHERLPGVPVIIMTAYGDLDTAVEAVRRGAFEYLVKPFDLDQVQRALSRALEWEPAPPAASNDVAQAAGLVGRSPEMQEVFKRIALAAATDATALVHGESGTGKELVARAIHRYSRRCAGPFIAVNIAALSPSLAESELFGHVRGAFTGAEQSRPGLLVRAHQGTLFLDEVAEIPLEIQVKLLRALEHGEVLPVGSTEPVRTDFRMVCATHRDLLQQVQSGEFRHDLYFRLGTFQIDLPPLRTRTDDIEVLAHHFLNQLATKTGSGPPAISPEALAEMKRRPWYGNVRELRNAIEHAVIVARGGTLSREHLPAPLDRSILQSTVAPADLEGQLQELIRRWTAGQLADPGAAGAIQEQLTRIVEPPLLELALEHSKGQCAAAARCLGMHRTTLRKKLEQYGIRAD